MRIIRFVVAAAITVFGGYVFHGLIWLPYTCNLTKHRVQRTVLEIFELPTVPNVAVRARQASESMQACLEACPADVDMYMTLAASDRILGRLQHALDMYNEALKYDRRPEIYFNLGMVQLQLARREEAIASLARQCTYDIYFATEIDDPAIHDAVIAEVKKQQDLASARLQKTPNR